MMKKLVLKSKHAYKRECLINICLRIVFEGPYSGNYSLCPHGRISSNLIHIGSSLLYSLLIAVFNSINIVHRNK